MYIVVVASHITWFRLRSIADLSCCPAFFSYPILLVLLLECCLLPLLFCLSSISEFQGLPRKGKKAIVAGTQRTEQTHNQTEDDGSRRQWIRSRAAGPEWQYPMTSSSHVLQLGSCRGFTRWSQFSVFLRTAVVPTIFSGHFVSQSVTNNSHFRAAALRMNRPSLNYLPLLRFFSKTP